MIHERDVIRLAGVTKDHRAVVLKISGSRAFVIWGTSVHRPDIESIAVDHLSRFGKALRLTARTYFQINHWQFVALEEVEKRKIDGHCPPELHVDLLELALRGMRFGLH